MAFLLRTVLAICLLAPLGASAAQIRYAWTGFAEPGFGNPWLLSGDGSASTQGDGTPFSIEVRVDESEPDFDTDEPSVARFLPSSAKIVIGGIEAAIVDLDIDFFDREAQVYDTIQVESDNTLRSATLYFRLEVDLPRDTFSLSQGPGFVDTPPLFGATSPSQLRDSLSDVLTYPANAPVTATLVPEPSTAVLLGAGLCVLSARRRASGRRHREPRTLSG
jgi:hypothetical protein